MDYLACGHPDISYHGVNAWQPEFENFRRQIGILYCGAYAKKPNGKTMIFFRDFQHALGAAQLCTAKSSEKSGVVACLLTPVTARREVFTKRVRNAGF